jgi:D-alanyl-D-alanine carboxypeptidase/D-alanyl-D-alanine-endopeptidase (penicillin-binding protein 4)
MYRSNLNCLIFGLIIVFLFPFSGISQQKAAKPAETALKRQEAFLKADPMMKHASWSYCVIRVRDKKIIAQFDADRGLVPASALKVLTTYAAWSVLGKDFRFKTILETDGHVEDSILKGNVYIRGGGDPTLGSFRFAGTDPDSLFDSLAVKLKMLDVHFIRGTVIGDASLYPDEGIPGSWNWSDIGNYYGAGMYGLNIAENAFKAVFRPGNKPGDTAVLIEIDPPVSGIRLENRVTTGKQGSGDHVIMYSAPFGNYCRMEGTVPAGVSSFVVKGSVPEPDLLAAQWLFKRLLISNISLTVEPTTTCRLRYTGNYINTHRETLIEHFSPSLNQIIQMTHEKSVNIFAESLLRAVGFKSKGSGSVSGGIDAVQDFWKSKGLDVSGMRLEDGSGLSPLNRISTSQLADAMRIIATEDSRKEFISTLNLAGETGNLKNLLNNTPAASNLRAKSGYLTGVRSYTGLVRDKAGDELAFAVIVNNYSGTASAMKQQLEKLLSAIANYPE